MVIKTIQNADGRVTLVILRHNAIVIEGPGIFDSAAIKIDKVGELIEALQKAEKLAILK